jgi:hypothetical protein
MKERLAGFLLLLVIAPMAILGYLTMCVAGTLGFNARARAGVRALDHFVNASLFNGYAWESVSSHAWREQHRWWARWIIKITDLFQKDHCKRANKREQPVVDFVLARGLEKQTIK